MSIQDSIDNLIHALIAQGEKMAEPLIATLTESMTGFGYGPEHPEVKAAMKMVRVEAVRASLDHYGFTLNDDGSINQSRYVARESAKALERAGLVA